jgi:hypothetical protein
MAAMMKIDYVAQWKTDIVAKQFSRRSVCDRIPVIVDGR